MTTYTAIPLTDIDTDSPITQALLTLIRDNPIAITEGSTGAPKIQQAALDTDSVGAAQILADAVGQSEIAANSVGQSEIKTTFQAISGGQYFTATGGVYILGSLSFRANALTNALTMESDSSGANDAGYIARWRFNSGGVGTFTKARLYYINSSPPYDLGDGHIPLFVYAVIDNTTGDVLYSSVSPDPPWAYNGPTDITPSRYDKRTGKAYRRVRDMSASPLPIRAAIAGGDATLARYLDDYKAADIIDQEIDQSVKNADMDLIPHPYTDNDLVGKTVVMLDPVSPAMESLLTLHDSSPGGVGEIMDKGFIKFGNTALTRKGPQGLMIVSAGWR